MLYAGFFALGSQSLLKLTISVHASNQCVVELLTYIGWSKQDKHFENLHWEKTCRLKGVWQLGFRLVSCQQHLTLNCFSWYLWWWPKRKSWNSKSNLRKNEKTNLKLRKYAKIQSNKKCPFLFHYSLDRWGALKSLYVLLTSLKTLYELNLEIVSTIQKRAS